jgi:alkylation response protein AidB-like acyl-CoA dehydrogenase
MLMTAAIRSVPLKPDVPELLSRARAIADIVRARVQETEANRRIADDVIAHMREAELFRILQPEAYGGFEYGFDVFAELVATIGRGCGSSAWVYGLGAVHQWFVACFPKETQEEFWADPGAIAAGSYAPVGKTVAADGGYRTSGVWSFVSGCDNAQWYLLSTMVPQVGASEAAKPSFLLVPREAARIDDNWHTMGLAGTGSKNIVADDLFVPAHRVLAIADLAAGTSPGTRINTNPLYRQSFLSVVPVTLIAPVLGMAEGALADFVDMVKVRATRGAVAGGNRRMAEFATIQSRVTEATGCIDAARLMMFRDLAETNATAERGEQTPLDMRLRNRLSHTFCTRLLVQAIDALFLASGGQGIFLEKPLQQAWRDAHAAASHISLNWDAVSTMYGQYALGLEPKGQY